MNTTDNGRNDGHAPHDRLWDSQWVNIVNSPEVLRAVDVEEAVNIAVRMTEQKMAENYRALSAASGKAVAWQFKDSEGRWCGFHNDKHRNDTIASGAWEVRPLYLHPATVTDEDVERLVAAARLLRERQRDYLLKPKGERSEDKGRLVGIAAQELDAALSSFANKENRND